MLSLKIPPHLNCVATLPCEMSSVLKATIENKTTSVTKHFKSALCCSKTDTLNILCKNCTMWQLLWTITETSNTLFPVVNFLKCVVTEVVLFSIVAFKTLYKVVQQHNWDVVGSLLQIFSWFWQWNNFENQLIFGKVKAYKKLCRFFGPPCMFGDLGNWWVARGMDVLHVDSTSQERWS